MSGKWANSNRAQRLPRGWQRIHRAADNTRMLEFYRPTITLEQGIARALEGQP